MTRKAANEIDATNNKSTIPKKKCIICNRSLSLKEGYYKTTDLLYYPDGKLNTCKKCCVSEIEDKGFVAFQSLMRLINKPILDTLFDGDIPRYIRIINSLPKYKDLTFLDSDIFNKKNQEKNIRPEDSKLEKEELEDLEYLFGEGYEPKQYIYLRQEFEDYCGRYVVDSKAMELLVSEIVLTQLDIRIARSNKGDVKALQKTLQDLLASANLKPVQETGSSSVDQESFGTLIKKWENEHPIPEPDKAWEDVDGIRKYIETYFMGHMARLLGKKNNKEKEYWEELGKNTITPPKDEDE